MSDLGISGAPDNGQGANGSENFDFQQAYQSLRPEYTRTTQDLGEAKQRLSEYESFLQALSDPETQREALAHLGFEMDTGASATAEEEFIDPLEAEVQRLNGIVQELQQGRELEAASQEERELTAMRDDFIGESIEYIESQFGVKFEEQDEEVLGNLAIAMSGADGVPDVMGAYNALLGDQGMFERRRSQWIDSKMQAYTAPLGSSIPADKRPTNRAERVDFVDRRLQALDAMQNG